jgi:hypothetical protein
MVYWPFVHNRCQARCPICRLYEYRGGNVLLGNTDFGSRGSGDIETAKIVRGLAEPKVGLLGELNELHTNCLALCSKSTRGYIPTGFWLVVWSPISCERWHSKYIGQTLISSVQTFSLPGSMYISILFGAAYGMIYGLFLSCLVGYIVGGISYEADI